jgi:4-diphosphocytidyl-2-C-methyl-D-erythritol kinase
VIVEAPAKLNLCLFVGPTRDDGLHEIRSLFEPLELADEITVEEVPGSEDEVICPGVEGPNLAARALEVLRERGWDSPPLRVEIDKKVPVAAGLGGGSADAAAVLRLALGEVEGIRDIAATVGADVPSQVQPRPCLVGGSGEVVEPISPPGEHGVVLVPHERGLSTAEVYAEADRLGPRRSPTELDGMRRKLHDATADGASPLSYLDLIVNDLQEAALSLRPEVADALSALEEAGAARGLVAGSGPTAFGLFRDQAAAEAGAEKLKDRFAGAIATAPRGSS